MVREIPPTSKCGNCSRLYSEHPVPRIESRAEGLVQESCPAWVAFPGDVPWDERERRSGQDRRAGSDGETTHYGAADDPYEVIKVVEAWGLGLHLGTAVIYIARAGKKEGNPPQKDLKKALYYIKRAVDRLEAGHSL